MNSDYWCCNRWSDWGGTTENGYEVSQGLLLNLMEDQLEIEASNLRKMMIKILKYLNWLRGMKWYNQMEVKFEIWSKKNSRLRIFHGLIYS